MVEYIEREKVVELSEKIKDNFAPLHRAVINAFIRYIDNNIPKADVVEVRHGEWEWYVEPRYDLYSCDENFGYRCSECKVWAGEYGVDDDIYEEPPTKILHYCPNCGAKMDGGK